ncbi:hypothetical protein CEF12_15560 [Enterococcus faecalis]|uniref:DUF961 domain-containing protein n=2 Tax=Enterococcus faecalis TaxID=1351 RepID=Q831G9_ENTFA|nr:MULTISPECIES: DUF961 family protein [Enterococcus]AAO82253.1 hypothetical protein EF_2540 [Enterococcus faecalis V583]AQL54375.1 hypothetical protein BZG32_11980 [Enterococcus faecalis]AXG89198.1 DUF961 domain-containing protein [Enterococcus faecalis]EOI08759.1 hypothetical protein UCK_02221 [Enterococcus faecalis EnGen0242]EOJ27632.1 hypothetical protein UMU_02072 [Enterococcus faecalis EnGen0300]
MGLTFENNTIENFDVQGTFGTMNFLEVVAINERDGEGNVTDEVREQRVTVYSSKLNDQVEIAIDPDYDVSGINYDDEIELTGNVTARGWLNTFKGFNDNVQTEQAFKVRSAGIKKVGAVKPTQTPQPREKQENK